jgi:hypothetical protein
MSGKSAPAWLVGALLVVLSVGCGANREVILRTAAGAEVTADQIDRQPLWLLPPGGAGWFHLAVQSAAKSQLGQRVLTELRTRMPLPESAGLVLDRDISELSVSVYSMKGVDFAGVASGHFDPERIAAAAIEYQGGPLVPPLTRSQYAGRTLFMAQNIGFSVITRQTALFGNEVGIRRCLDRIAEGRVADELPGWVKELLATPSATFSVGVDLEATAVTAALPSRLSALQGARLARGIGNFDPPGINLAATLTHGDHQAAQNGASSLLQGGGALNMYARLFGLGQPIKKLETQAVGSDTQVVLAVDGAAVELLMQRFLPPAPPPAPHSGPGWAGDSSRVSRVSSSRP